MTTTCHIDVPQIERRYKRVESRITVLRDFYLSPRQRSLLAGVGLKFLALSEKSKEDGVLWDWDAVLDEAEDVIDRVFAMMADDDRDSESEMVH